MALPPPFVQSGSLHGAAEALEQKVKDAQRESGMRLTGGRRTAPQARQMGQMTAGRVTVQHLRQEELHGGDWREHTVAPGGIPDLTAYRQEGFGWQPHGPLASETWQDRRDVRNHLMTSCTIRMFLPIPTGDV
jgi:hypothetical protein